MCSSTMFHARTLCGCRLRGLCLSDASGLKGSGGSSCRPALVLFCMDSSCTPGGHGESQRIGDTDEGGRVGLCMRTRWTRSCSRRTSISWWVAKDVEPIIFVLDSVHRVIFSEHVPDVLTSWGILLGDGLLTVSCSSDSQLGRQHILY